MSMRFPGGGCGTNLMQNDLLNQLLSALSPEAQQILKLLALPRAGPPRSDIAIGSYIAARRGMLSLNLILLFAFIVYVAIYFMDQPVDMDEWLPSIYSS